MYLGGTVWLQQLQRRARQDGRVLLAEGALIALLTGVLNALREVSTEEYFRLSFPPAAVITGGLIGLALWFALGAPLYAWAQLACARYCVDVLTGSGLLYLALEHEPGEELALLKCAENLKRLGFGAPVAHSFRERIQTLLAKYPAATRALGYPAYPALVRRVASLVNIALAGLLVFFALLVRRELLAARVDLDPRLALLVRYFSVAIALILLRAVFQLACATGLRLGLCALLLGEEEA
jgi:hypothetical protein